MEPNTNPPIPPNLTPPSYPTPNPSPNPGPPAPLPPAGPAPTPPLGTPPPAVGTPPPAPGPAMMPPLPPQSPAPGGQVISGGFNPSASSLPGSPANPAGVGGVMPPTPPAAPAPPPLAGAPTGMIVGATDPMGAAAAPPSASASRRWLKPLLIAVVAVMLVGGGSAAAYFGIVVPNQPANVLKQALVNTLEQTQSNATGSIDDSAQGVKVGFNSAENTSTKAADIQLNITVSGITFPIEGRLVNHSIYVKLGDLSSIAATLNGYSPQFGQLAQAVSSQLSNQWIVFDSTLLDQSSQFSCVLDSSWTLTKADVTLIENQYSAHPFTTIQSTASATVAGAAAEKFNLSIDNAAFNSFGDGLRNLSLIKTMSKCTGASNTPMGASANHGHTNLTVWVDKSTKRIVQVANTTSGALTTVTINYKPVNITAPSGAKPALQVLSQLQSALTSSGINLSQLFSGAAPTSGATTL